VSSETTLAAAKAPRKQQQRSIVTQQKLLDAAIEAFSENGFKGTSTRDIAERAGVHHPLITYHFKNKDRLWRAAADRIFNDFARALGQSMQDRTYGSPKERMAALIRAYVYYARSHPALHRVMVQEASYPNPRLDWLIETHLKPMFELAFGLLSELQQLGVAPKGDPKLLFNMIRLASGGLLSLGNELKASSDIDVDDDATIDEIADMIVAVFLPGDCPTTT
jgi:TetR/AcrR family transcriptional regulator